MSKEDAITEAEVLQLQAEIVAEAERLAVSILRYLRGLESTGIRTPPPPRPKHEIFERLHYAVRWFESVTDSQERVRE